MFSRNKIPIEMIENLRPTSKASLKQMCLLSSNGDIDKASKLYEFMIKDMDELPMFDVVPPSKLSQVRDSVADAWSWVNDNQENIMNWIEMAKSMFGKGSSATSKVAQGASQIPNINQ